MARFKMVPTTADLAYNFTAKVTGDPVDADVGKPFKINPDASDTFMLCASGDEIDAFLVSVESATADGLKICTLSDGRVKIATAKGATQAGATMVAGVPSAMGTAEESGYPSVVAGAATAGHASWKVVSTASADGSVASGDTITLKRY